MAKKVETDKQQPSKSKKFINFLKKNMTLTWFSHVSYQAFAFITSVAMIFGVATYAFNKSYDEKVLKFMDDFTITAHTGAYDTPDNSMESLEAAIKNNVNTFEVDVRQRPDGTVVMGHDIITTNTGGVEMSSVFEKIKPTDITLNLDIKETRALKGLYKLIVEYNMINRVYLTGIEYFQAEKVKENCPEVEYYVNYLPSRIKIFSEDYQQKILELMEETGAVGINCNHANASRTLSKLLHDNGYKLSVWTVDKKYQIKRALVNKPDNLTTHYPDKVQKMIDNWGE